jgi:hypothetical protein
MLEHGYVSLPWLMIIVWGRVGFTLTFASASTHKDITMASKGVGLLLSLQGPSRPAIQMRKDPYSLGLS